MSRKPPEGPRRQGGSRHTPGDAMRCQEDGQPWPCWPWRVARAVVDRSGRARQGVIFPENGATPWRRP